MNVNFLFYWCEMDGTLFQTFTFEETFKKYCCEEHPRFNPNHRWGLKVKGTRSEWLFWAHRYMLHSVIRRYQDERRSSSCCVCVRPSSVELIWFTDPAGPADINPKTIRAAISSTAEKSLKCCLCSFTSIEVPLLCSPVSGFQDSQVFGIRNKNTQHTASAHFDPSIIKMLH